MSEDDIILLNWLLYSISSWTTARWDQHLKFEFGDERAHSLIDFLINECGVDDPNIRLKRLGGE